MFRSSINFPLLLIVLIVVLLISIILALGMGSVDLDFTAILNSLLCYSFSESCGINQVHHQIVWDIRFPRIIMALLTGAGLAVTGVILQSVTRNPLADPYLFGISSGAAFGAVLSMSISGGVLLGTSADINDFSVTTGAFLGASLSVILMLTLAGRQVIQVDRLLLSGVAVSFMLSAFTSLILYYSEPEVASTLLFWMMGSFSNSQWSQLGLPSLILLTGVCVFFIFRHWISAIQVGDETALTLGVPVNKLRLMMLIVSAAITGVLVAHVGGIGFVGLMIPHIARFIIGNQVHQLMSVSLLLGGIFMVWVDVLARTLFEHQVLPIGIVTSAVGSIFFFIILKNKKI